MSGRNICMYIYIVLQFRDFRRVWHFHAASLLLGNARVSSYFSYCSLLFRSSAESDLHKLLRIASNASKYITITPVPQKLFWLPKKYIAQCSKLSGWSTRSLTLVTLNNHDANCPSHSS